MTLLPALSLVSLTIMLAAALSALLAVPTQSHTVVHYQRCIVASTNTPLTCASVFNVNSNSHDPYFIDDGIIYPNLQMALDECPFSPVLIEVHGTILAGEQPLVFSQNKDLILRGIHVGPLAKIIGFSNLTFTHHTKKKVMLEDIIVDGCGTQAGLFSLDGVSPCLDKQSLVVLRSTAQNYHGNHTVCMTPNITAAHLGCGSSCGNGHEYVQLIVTESTFINISYSAVYTKNVEYQAVTKSTFCPCNTADPDNGKCVQMLTTFPDTFWEFSDNTFCQTGNHSLGVSV